MKRVNIKLAGKLHTKAKVISVLKGITLNDYFEKAIEEHIKKDQKLIDNLSK
ncbi:hypothetical protein GOV04_03110 [Candidatus Woesearchaeota archaeon]|nr:hypothetical protein [Candidatus Woesearchaeota archaeon]